MMSEGKRQGAIELCLRELAAFIVPVRLEQCRRERGRGAERILSSRVE